MSKAYRFGQSNPFMMNDDGADLSNREELDAAIYGSPALVVSGKAVKAHHVGIDQVVPDYRQPRRALPSQVRAFWDGNPAALGDVLREWVQWAQEQGVDAVAMLSGVGDGDEDEVEHHPVTLALIRLLGLAASIKAEGLTNPITVIDVSPDVRNKAEKVYRIETGERRWLAFHLLRAVEGDAWDTIPARVMESFDVWRQAGENNTRDDLNAISKARQFAVLLMDLYADEFAAMDAFAHEQAFYAQVADGNVWRVPRGKGAKLLAAMGLKNGRQLRDYRALLRLDPDIWTLADDVNAPERLLRDALGKSRDEGYAIIMQWLEDRDSVPTGTVTEGSPGKQVTAERPTLSREAKQAKKYGREIERALIDPDADRRLAADYAVWMAEYYANLARELMG